MSWCARLWGTGLFGAGNFFDDLVENIGATPEDALPLDAVALRLIVAGLLGFVIGKVYRRTFTGKKFNPTLPDTHVLLCLGGAMIWLVVGNNLVRAFGLAGTIGLIRYRTRVRDPKDTTILLFSMILGMASGLGQFPVAIVGASSVLITLTLLHRGHQQRAARLFGPIDDDTLPNDTTPADPPDDE